MTYTAIDPPPRSFATTSWVWKEWHNLKFRVLRPIGRHVPFLHALTDRLCRVDGARRRRLKQSEYAQRFQVNDPVNIIYGTFVLWIGWLSFNCSGTLGLTEQREALTARVGVVTCMGGACGAIAGMLHSLYVTRGKSTQIEPASVGALAGLPPPARARRRTGPVLSGWRSDLTASRTLAGLVSITAACAYIGVWEGALAGCAPPRLPPRDVRPIGTRSVHACARTTDSSAACSRARRARGSRRSTSTTQPARSPSTSSAECGD